MTNPPRIESCVRGDVPSMQPPSTDAAVRDAEKTLGLRRPLEYIAALRDQNGGDLRHGWRPCGLERVDPRGAGRDRRDRGPARTPGGVVVIVGERRGGRGYAELAGRPR